MSVGAVEVGLLDRRLTLHDLRSKQLDGLSARDGRPPASPGRSASCCEGARRSSAFVSAILSRRTGSKSKDLRVKASGDQTWAFGTVVLEGLDLARFDAALPPGPLQAGALGARLMKALSLRRFEERDAIYTAPFSANTVGFVRLTGENYDHGKLGSLALSHLEATSKTATEPSFALGGVKASGLDLTRILTAMSEPSWRPGMPVGRLDRRAPERHRLRRRTAPALRHLAGRRDHRHDA